MSDVSIYQGAHSVDMSSLSGKLIDLTPEQRRFLRTDWESFDKAQQELLAQFPQKGAVSGISQDVYDDLVEAKQIIDTIDAKLADLRKLLEVVEETRAYYVNQRQSSLSLAADAVQSRARRKRDASILAPFAELLRYASQPGTKAAKTRKKNQEQQEPTVEAPTAEGTR